VSKENQGGRPKATGDAGVRVGPAGGTAAARDGDVASGRARREAMLLMLCCPQCRATLRLSPGEDRVYCNNDSGGCSIERGYPLVGGQPALVVFERSVLSEAWLMERGGGSPIRRSQAGGLVRSALRGVMRALRGGNRVAAPNCRKFLGELHKRTAAPVVLIVGGGVAGSGTHLLREEGEKLRLLCFDIYATAETDFIADAHDIPLPDASVDGVWIQAVLEHVIQPDRVVAEIHRVLKPGGIVYAEIPFMQTVHEAAYDFTRYSDTGMRWLFRWFDRIQSGTVLGPGSALLWSITAALAGLFRSQKAGNLIGTVLFFWVRLLDYVIPAPFAIDAACGLYFLGRKAAAPISRKEAIASFQGVSAS
jgi:SAM-dependent methyltransferase